ncbi:MAG: hypothetical protein SH821_05600 [Phototrophicales bacterium]|nr:hypothetical protein [Phototrophicales bacterium]
MNTTKVSDLTVDELFALIRQAIKEALHEEDNAQSMETDTLGWPVGFFERTYGAFADNPIERPEQLSLETREELE